MRFLLKKSQHLLSSFSVSLDSFFLICCNIVGFFLMLLASPIVGLMFLFLPSLYFILRGKFKLFFIFLGVYFSLWYLSFIFVLIGYEGPILIGGEHTREVFHYFSILFSRAHTSSVYIFLFEHVGVQTLFLLHILSEHLGFPIWIPSVLKVILLILKYIFKGPGDPPVQCAPEKGSKGSSSDAPSQGMSSSVDPCMKMKKAILAGQNPFLYVGGYKTGVVDDSFVYYGEIKVPKFIPKFGGFFLSFCHNRPATSEEVKNKKG